MHSTTPPALLEQEASLLQFSLAHTLSVLQLPLCTTISSEPSRQPSCNNNYCEYLGWLYSVYSVMLNLVMLNSVMLYSVMLNYVMLT